MKKKFTPDFNEMLKVLRKEKPSRPVLFELFMNGTVYQHLSNKKFTDEKYSYEKTVIDAFCAGGYDYASMAASGFYFTQGESAHLKTKSLNDGSLINDFKTFESYKWNDPDSFDYTWLNEIGKYMPDGMKLMIMGPCGVLENVIGIMGYENLCIAIYEEPELARLMFENVGERLVKYYKNALEYDCVGMIMSNDDWGFKTQTFLSVEHMREYVFPWHKKIAETAHNAGRPVLLHSCGYAEDVMNDIIHDIKFDARHSYEDIILPIEESYKKWGGQIGIMGGIDVDFLVRNDIDAIKDRCRNMLDLSETKGGYALGSGNSIPEYITVEKYMAMIETAWERR